MYLNDFKKQFYPRLDNIIRPTEEDPLTPSHLAHYTYCKSVTAVDLTLVQRALSTTKLDFTCLVCYLSSKH